MLDNFYDSGEVSGDGHVWSNAAISSDYNEKTWQQSYRGNERVYDYEGVVENGYPLREGISDVNEPGSGYLWTDLARNGKSLYHFGEFISTKFCSSPDMAPKGSSPPKEPLNRCRRSVEPAVTFATGKRFRKIMVGERAPFRGQSHSSMRTSRPSPSWWVILTAIP